MSKCKGLMFGVQNIQVLKLSGINLKLFLIQIIQGDYWLPFWSTWVLVGFVLLYFCSMCMFYRSLFVLLYFFFWPLRCLFFFNIRILITSLVSFDHCVVCPSSIYRFWLPLWYLLVIVLSVLLQYTDSDYLFGIVKLFLRLIVDHKYNMLIYTTMYFHLLSKYSMQVVIFSCPVWCNTGTNSSRCLNTAEIIRFNINNLWLLGFLCQLSRLLASGEFRGVISWATDDARP